MAKAKSAGVDFEGTESGTGGGLAINLAGVEAGGQYVALPRGTYDVEIIDLEFGYSQSSGNPMWTWTLQVHHDEHENRRLFYHTTFTEGGLPRVRASLERIRLDDPGDEDYRNELLSSEFNPEQVAEDGRLIGARARARVTTRKYEGEMRNNVRDLLAPSDEEL